MKILEIITTLYKYRDSTCWVGQDQMPSKLDSVAISLESLRYENRTQAEYIAKLIPQRVHAKWWDLMQFRVARDSKLVGKCFGIICALLEYNVS